MFFKKIMPVIAILLLTLVLTACGKEVPNTTSQSTNSISSDNNHDSSIGNNSSDDQTDDSATSSNEPRPHINMLEPDTKTVQEYHSPISVSSRIQDLNKQLRAHIGKIALPQADGLAQGSDNLNMRYTGDSSNYSIFYTVGNTPIKFNSGLVAKQNPYAVLTKQTFASADEAKQQIAFEDKQTLAGLPTTDLGSGLHGALDQGAGTIRVMWNEGRWSIRVNANALEKQDPQPLAKEVVRLLDRYLLPAPNQLGQITLTPNIMPEARDQIIKWQDGNIVYSLVAHDPRTAIKMVASFK